MGEFCHLGRDLGVKDGLSEAFTVAEVDEDDAAVVASRLNPADEGDGVIDVGGAEFGAVMSSHEEKFWTKMDRMDWIFANLVN